MNGNGKVDNTTRIFPPTPSADAKAQGASAQPGFRSRAVAISKNPALKPANDAQAAARTAAAKMAKTRLANRRADQCSDGPEAGLATGQPGFRARTSAVSARSKLAPARNTQATARPEAAATAKRRADQCSTTQGVSLARISLLASGGAGQTREMSAYLADHVAQGDIPRELVPDLETAITYVGRAGKDMAHASELLAASDQGKPLSEDRQSEVQALLASNKYNLSMMQSWLVAKEAQLGEGGRLSSQTKTLIRAVQECIYHHHNNIADLIPKYGLDEIPQEAEAVSRSDRINANLLQADSALKVARQLSVPGLAESEKASIVQVLEEHHADLAQARDISKTQGIVGSRSDEKLSVRGKEVWGNPFTLVLPKKGKKSSIKELAGHWDDKLQNKSSQPWLPLAHEKVGQSRMLQEFISHRLLAAGVKKRDLPDLAFLFQLAKNQTFNEQAWEPIHMELRYDLPAPDPELSAETRLAKSDITPAKAFAKNFPQDYTANGINCADRLEYRHAPNLAHTQLTGQDNKVLFSGLRHGVLDAYDLTGKSLNKLPDATVRTMISELLVRDGALSVPEGLTHEAFTDNILGSIRSSSKSAAQYADMMRTEASKNMAQEMAVTALVTDPAKFQSALDGKVVTLDLSSISLLTPDHLRPIVAGSKSNEKAMLKYQTAALRGLAKNNPATLKVRDAAGELKTVRANINVRTFNFGVNGGAVGSMKLAKVVKIPSHTHGWSSLMGWKSAMEQNNPELASLLGPDSESALGGDARERLDQMITERVELRARLTGINDAAPVQSAEEHQQIEEKIAQLDKDITKLAETAKQLKDIWTEGSYLSGGQDPYKMVSRLALMTHLMGETTLFNCKSGKDRTGQLDAEVKCLATYAEERGEPYSPEKEVEGLREMRGQFTMGTGNLEMQRLNTGLPGYKLKWSEVPGLARMVASGDVEDLYRAGSDYVAA